MLDKIEKGAEKNTTKLLSYDRTPPQSQKSEVFEWCEKSFIDGVKSKEAKEYWLDKFKKS